MNKLAASLEALQGRKLSTDELQKLQSFQKLYQVDDEDPLLVVLAMMANAQLVLESAPALIHAEVEKTIEHHRTNLRDQAVLISKELITVISKQVQGASNAKKGPPWEWYICSFVCGMAFMVALFVAFKHFVH